MNQNKIDFIRDIKELNTKLKELDTSKLKTTIDIIKNIDDIKSMVIRTIDLSKLVDSKVNVLKNTEEEIDKIAKRLDETDKSTYISIINKISKDLEVLQNSINEKIELNSKLVDVENENNVEKFKQINAVINTISKKLSEIVIKDIVINGDKYISFIRKETERAITFDIDTSKLIKFIESTKRLSTVFLSSNQESTGVSNHNDLEGLQGGTTGEYYHLTEDEYTNRVSSVNGQTGEVNLISDQIAEGGTNLYFTLERLVSTLLYGEPGEVLTTNDTQDGYIWTYKLGETFESVSKNLRAYPPTYNYTDGILTSVDYTTPSGTITKSLTYTNGLLTSIDLSGDLPIGIETNKTLIYTGGVFSGATYY